MYTHKTFIYDNQQQIHELYNKMNNKTIHNNTINNTWWYKYIKNKLVIYNL